MSVGSAFLVIVLSVWSCDALSEEVRLVQGRIRGRSLVTEKGTQYFAFQGIPYAEPPVGNLRFKLLREALPWTGTLNATSDHIICPQLEVNTVKELVEQEDCLQINVYVPKTTNKQILPVVFWIHGGGFIYGYASHVLYGPDYFLDHEVILVSANYRLGAFGFMSTGDDQIPGNLGLKDQQFALKWVQKNIHYFGGDQNKVTIFGESSGGCAVTFHLLSKNSKGLFHAAMSSSGSALNPECFQRDPLKYALKTAIYADKRFQTRQHSTKEIKDFLMSLTEQELLEASKKVKEEEEAQTLQMINGMYYAPVLEPPSEPCFICQKMFKSFEEGSVYKVPLLIGVNSEEGLLLADNQTFLEYFLNILDGPPKNLVPISFNLQNEEKLNKVGSLIKEVYVQNDSFSNRPAGGIQYFSDSVMNKGSIKLAQLYSKFSKNIYFYIFSYFGMLGQSNTTVLGAGKVSHFADMFYLFRFGSNELKNYPKKDVLTHDRLSKMWSNFIKYHNPTPSTDKLLQNVIWPSVKFNQNMDYLDIGDDLMLRKNPKSRTFKKWDDLMKQYGQQPFITF